jgi:trehalose 6-phosphate synthase
MSEGSTGSDRPQGLQRQTGRGGFGFVVVANRLPVDRVDPEDPDAGWRPSPGGLVAAVTPVMRQADGVWVGWPGAPGEVRDPDGTSAPERDELHHQDQDHHQDQGQGPGRDRSEGRVQGFDPGPVPESFEVDGIHVAPVALAADDIEDYNEGFSNATLWPLYHDVIVPPQFHRGWWDAYTRVNWRFARAAAAQAGPVATVWVHDYQLQLVPAMLRRLRPDLRIGFFDHIPFPGYEIFAQLPWRRQIVDRLLGSDLIGFQRAADVTNFLRACRRAAGRTTRADVIAVAEEPGGVRREVRVGAFAISIDFAALDRLARTPVVESRARDIRAELGDPGTVLLGVDRLDYTKGILHRLKAYEELLDEGKLAPGQAAFVQVASPSRERVAEYQALRQDVEAVVGRTNGRHGSIGRPAVHYLHQSYSKEEMAALYRAADVMVVTPLRDGMNLAAKEYVACRYTEDGALVLSEFTGAADELGAAFLVNPHDITGLKEVVLRACSVGPREARRRMRALRKRVRDADVACWASTFLDALAAALLRPDARAPSTNIT